MEYHQRIVSKQHQKNVFTKSSLLEHLELFLSIYLPKCNNFVAKLYKKVHVYRNYFEYFAGCSNRLYLTKTDTTADTIKIG